MDEQKTDLGVSRPGETEDDLVRRLLESAGPRPEIDPAELEAISLAARNAWQASIQKRTRRAFHPAMALAASLAILAIGLSFFWVSRNQAGSSSPAARVDALHGVILVEVHGQDARALVKGESIPIGAMISSRGETSTAGRVSLSLLSGAVVRIDAGARVRFIASGVVKLEKGALYADTGRRPGSHVEVRTAAGTARDIGTQFIVRLPENGEAALQVLVREGSVVVERGGRSYVTPAGRELLIRGDGTADLHDVAAHGPEWEWILDTAGEFAIEGRSLQEFLDWVARETGWRIRFEDQELETSARGITLHGGMGELRADRAPFVVLPGAGLDAELRGGELIIRRTR